MNRRAVFAAVVAILPDASFAQPDCGDWNTKAFFETASAGDVEFCLRRGADIKTPDWDGNTPLQVAAEHGNADAVTALISLGADIEARGENGATPLHWASTADAVNALIALGADIEARDSFGATPLNGAYSTETVIALLEARAEPNTREESRGFTPLHYAALWGNTEAIEALVTAGAAIEARDSIGETPLHKAAQSESANAADAVNELVDAGADIHARREYIKSGGYLFHGLSPYDHARQNPNLQGTVALRRLGEARSEQSRLRAFENPGNFWSHRTQSPDTSRLMPAHRPTWREGCATD